MPELSICDHIPTCSVIGVVWHHRLRLISTTLRGLLSGRGEMRRLRVGLVSPTFLLLSRFECPATGHEAIPITFYCSLALIRHVFQLGFLQELILCSRSRAHPTWLGFQNQTHQSRACVWHARVKSEADGRTYRVISAEAHVVCLLTPMDPNAGNWIDVVIWASKSPSVALRPGLCKWRSG